jgi:hypothetical protein
VTLLSPPGVERPASSGDLPAANPVWQSADRAEATSEAIRDVALHDTCTRVCKPTSPETYASAACQGKTRDTMFLVLL